jgi:hypothetical protein
MQDAVASLVSLVLLGPLEAEIIDRLSTARAPQAVVSQVTACVREAVPATVSRTVDDPWWAATSVISLWIGSARPDALLVEAAPACAPALEAARPFLTEMPS